MKATAIAGHESRFDGAGVDSDGKEHVFIKKSIEISGEDSFMDYVEVRPASGDESYFYGTKFKKEQIVLHYTMGYLGGDVATLTQKDYHVSVPFVIGRNGTIYNLFPSFYWSYHLGRGAIGGNKERSRATIGVEISNIGPLKKSGDSLVTTYSDDDVYCGIDEGEFFEEKTFRGYDYYAAFTEGQYESLTVLLRYLTARYRIPRVFLDAAGRFDAGAGVPSFRGILSHVNYRPAGKTDVGPAFDWDRVVRGVTA